MKNHTSRDPGELRRQAEERLCEKQRVATGNKNETRAEDTAQILHELRVHQIELEMQNEELRRSQMAIEAGRARYFDLYDLAPVGYCTLSEQGLILEANLTTATLLGMARRALVRQPLSHFIVKDDQDNYYLHRKQLFETGKAQECELRLVKPDGARFWAHLRATAAQAEDGTPVCRVVISDITERKRLESQLEERFKEYRDLSLLFETVFDAIPDMIGIQELDHTIVRYNKAIYEYLQLSPENVRGKKCFQLLGRETPCDVCATAEVYETKKPSRIEKYIPEISRWVDIRAYPVIGENGDIIKVIEHWRDITKRKQAEAEQRDFERKREQARHEECLSRMSGAIAHLFNNHLAVVLGSLELLADDLKPEASGTQYLREAQTAAHRAAEISGLMLTFLGHDIGNREPVNLSEVCRKTLTLLTGRFPSTLHITTEFSAHGPIIQANTALIKQVLTNLVVNAAEALGEGKGSIGITTAVILAADIHATRVCPFDWEPKDETYACLSVTDTGGGMDPDIVEKIFDPFFSTKFTGRGIGLPVVLGIVKAHAGAVSVESRPGAGTVVRVFLPLIEERPPETAPPVGVSPPPVGVSASPVGVSPPPVAGQCLVLVVDEDPALRKLARAILGKIGFEAVVAPSGTDAVAIFRQRPQDFRCVLCDLTMPGMNGWQTLSALRQIRADIPVVLCSGYDETEVMATTWADRPQAFLGKPYGNKTLLAALAKALG